MAVPLLLGAIGLESGAEVSLAQRLGAGDGEVVLQVVAA